MTAAWSPVPDLPPLVVLSYIDTTILGGWHPRKVVMAHVPTIIQVAGWLMSQDDDVTLVALQLDLDADSDERGACGDVLGIPTSAVLSMTTVASDRLDALTSAPDE